MEITDLNGRRFEVALELLKEGNSDLVFNNVSFALNENGKKLDVRSITNWKDEITNQEAFQDIQRGIDTFARLMEASPAFVKTVNGYSPRFSLIDDYGSGSVEICRFEDGQINWTSR